MLRFFTVYGPWGRPDMAAYSFAHAVANREPLQLYEVCAAARVLCLHGPRTAAP